MGLGAAVRVRNIVIFWWHAMVPAGSHRQRNERSQALAGIALRQGVATNLLTQTSELEQRECALQGARPGDESAGTGFQRERQNQISRLDVVGGQGSRSELRCISSRSFEQRNHRARDGLANQCACASARHRDGVSQVQPKQALRGGGSADVAGANRQDTNRGRDRMGCLSHRTSVRMPVPVPVPGGVAT